MTRHEFDKLFLPMARALLEPKKVNKAQADYFYDYYKGMNVHDFRTACAFLARGNPGFLPKQSQFDDSISASKEMRLEREKITDKKNADEWLKHGHKPIQGLSPMEHLWGEVCSLNLRKLFLADKAVLTQDQIDAVESIEFALGMPDFVKAQGSWRTVDDEHPCLWLTKHVAKFKARWPEDRFKPTHTTPRKGAQPHAD